MHAASIVVASVARLSQKCRCIVSPHVDESPFGHLAESGDIFMSCDRQGDRVSHFLNEQIRREWDFSVEGAIEGGDYGLFDLRSTESIAGTDDFLEVERLIVLFAKTEMDLPNGFSFPVVWEIDEKDFIESPFA